MYFSFSLLHLFNFIKFNWVIQDLFNTGDGFKFDETASNNNPDQGPLYVTYTATHNDDDSDLTVTFSFLVSEVAGIVDEVCLLPSLSSYILLISGKKKEIKLVPKSLESVVRIQNHKYADKKNHLRLQIGVASADLSFSGSNRDATSDGGSKYNNNNNNNIFFHI